MILLAYQLRYYKNNISTAKDLIYNYLIKLDEEIFETKG